MLHTWLLLLLALEATIGDQGYFIPKETHHVKRNGRYSLSGEQQRDGYFPQYFEDDETREKFKEETLRPRKRQGRSFPQSPMVNILMQSIAPNYSPNNPGDLFDILRDSYPLPNGKLILNGCFFKYSFLGFL